MDLCGLHYRKIGGLVTLQPSAHLAASQAIAIQQFSTIAQQPAGKDVVALVGNRRHPVADREIGDLLEAASEASTDHKSADVQLCELGKASLQFGIVTSSQHM